MFGDRLRKQLDQEGLSPSQFADTLGVNRSAISHLLNNRNNPGYDFLNKLNEHYPDWDMDWLLFDKPRSKRAKPRVEQPSHEKPSKSAKEATEPQNTSGNQTQYAQADLFNESPAPSYSAQSHKARIEKRVTKTILIYSDGTFEIYQNNFQ